MDSAVARTLMSKSQLLTNHVQDERVIDAIEAVKREDFVPEAFAQSAYVDDEIMLAPERYLLEPLVFAQMLELADITPDASVLDIGCGLGYSAAVLSKLCKRVTAVENHPELVNEARKRLSKMKNVDVMTAPLVNGCPAHGPYDAIIIEGAVQHVPEVLIEQLKEGGRLVTVENVALRPGADSGLGTLVKITKLRGHEDRFHATDASVPVMPGFKNKTSFQF